MENVSRRPFVAGAAAAGIAAAGLAATANASEAAAAAHIGVNPEQQPWEQFTRTQV